MIKLIKSSFYNESATKQSLVDFIMQADHLSMGQQCKNFEVTFAKKQNRSYATYVSSGSAANLGLLQALLNTGRLRKGSRVGFSALTWATNVMPIIQLGMVPVAIDCEIDTLNISPEVLARAGSLDALFLTNVLGFCDDLPGIVDYCKRNSIVFLEDNCESLGSVTSGKKLGNFGLASTFSFYVGHHISTIEGGMICTDDEALGDALVMVRAHGWDRNLTIEKQRALRAKHNVGDFFSLYTFYDVAYNLRPTEIQGFIGNTQIGNWDVIVRNRASNFKRFQEAASKNPSVYPLRVDHMDTVSNFAMPIVLTSPEAFKHAQAVFTEGEVQIRPIISGNITEQPFYKKYVAHPESCSNAELVHNQGLYIPNNPELTDAEVQLLCDLISKV